MWGEKFRKYKLHHYKGANVRDLKRCKHSAYYRNVRKSVRAILHLAACTDTIRALYETIFVTAEKSLPSIAVSHGAETFRVTRIMFAAFNKV
jgi:hypothetical protein